MMNEVQTADRPHRPASAEPQVELGLLDHLLIISKTSRSLLGVRLAAIGLNVGQDQMIDLLKPDVPSKVGEVADALNVRPSTVSKMADRLCARDLVQKSHVELDARCTELRLTSAGEAKRAEVHRCWNEIEADLVRSYPALKEPGVRQSLDEVERLLRSRLSRLR